jgi:hypothetical protein
MTLTLIEVHSSSLLRVDVSDPTVLAAALQQGPTPSLESLAISPSQTPNGHNLTEYGYWIHANIYFLPCSEPPNNPSEHHFFSIEGEYVYCPFARDFGPFNLGVVLRFCESMEEKRSEFQNCKIILHCPHEREKCTNVAFLLGSYMVRTRIVFHASFVKPF